MHLLKLSAVAPTPENPSFQTKFLNKSPNVPDLNPFSGGIRKILLSNKILKLRLITLNNVN